ncbi:hypothetical protein ACQPW3_23575 [Actinosynnema sp. CA-248983]
MKRTRSRARTWTTTCATPVQGMDFTTIGQYRAEASLFQTSEKVGRAVCVRGGEASFRYEP